MPTTLLILDRALRSSDNITLNEALLFDQPVLALVNVRAQPAWLSDALPMRSVSVQPTLSRSLAWSALAGELDRINIPLISLDTSNENAMTDLIEQCDARLIVAPVHVDFDQQALLSRLPVWVHRRGDNHLLPDHIHRDLPSKLMGRFTAFYHSVQKMAVADIRSAPLAPVNGAASIPSTAVRVEPGESASASVVLPVTANQISEWLNEYFWQEQAVLNYKQTRNQLTGRFSFSRLSGALALGSCSVRELEQQISLFEQKVQANESTRALRYELYWREYFQWMGRKLGASLYGSRQPKLSEQQQQDLTAWCLGKSGCDLVDAAMNELRQTGFISNRARQLTASWLVHDLGVPWQYGAAWFEHNLIDFDPNSNTGNWAYIAGGNAVSRKHHVFDLTWQTQHHDPQGLYRRCWL